MRDVVFIKLLFLFVTRVKYRMLM